MGHKKGSVPNYDMGISLTTVHSQTTIGNLKAVLQDWRDSEVSNRDVTGLTGGEGSYTSEARSWSNTPLFRGGRRVGWVGECGELSITGKLTSGGIISYQGNQLRNTPFTLPLIKNNHQLVRPGASTRKVSCVSRCRWSRHWSDRGCIESKRAITVTDLTTQYSVTQLWHYLLRDRSHRLRTQSYKTAPSPNPYQTSVTDQVITCASDWR